MALRLRRGATVLVNTTQVTWDDSYTKKTKTLAYLDDTRAGGVSVTYSVDMFQSGGVAGDNLFFNSALLQLVNWGT